MVQRKEREEDGGKKHQVEERKTAERRSQKRQKREGREGASGKGF